MDKIHKLKFSDNLRRQLAIHKKTQSDLSRYLNVSTATTSEWCTGKKMPRTDKIQSICKWLCIEMDELFKENQDNVPKTKLNLLKSDMIISEISERKYNERMEILKKSIEKFPPERREYILDVLISTAKELELLCIKLDCINS